MFSPVPAPISTTRPRAPATSALRRRRTAEIGMRIEYRQQRQSDSGFICRSHNPFGQLGRIRVRLACRIAMKIVKLAHPRESAFQHFDVGQRSDSFDLLGVEVIEEPVHHLAPGPEIIALRPPHFRKPSHAALKTMTVDIAETRDGHRMPLVV